MSSKDTFGLELRRAREARGLSLDEVAARTKVSGALWKGLERGDLSRWPPGIYARSYVRAYAEMVGLDAQGVVDEFCRLFPQADRRAEPLIRGQAEIIGHPSAWTDEFSEVFPEHDRRGSKPGVPLRATGGVRLKRATLARSVAAAIDAAVPLVVAAGARGLGGGFWGPLGAAALAYHLVSLLWLGCTPGSALVDRLYGLPAFPAAHRRPATVRSQQ